MGIAQADEQEEADLTDIWPPLWSYCYPVRGTVTLDDLYRVPDKRGAELIDGKIEVLAYMEALPGRAAAEILFSLMQYGEPLGLGRVFGSKIGYEIDLPHRKSFSPRASFYNGPSNGMKFPIGAPIFAAEIRNSWEQGAAVDTAYAVKRTDYFAAGTLVVWDVDLLSEDVVRVYRATDPTTAQIYRRGEVAEAEPAVPGWQMPVDDLFL